MHEYSIASSLLRMVQERAHEHAASRVVGLSVRIGELSGIEVPLLETAWSLVRERSVCEGADLSVQWVRARWVCADCGGEIERGARLACGRCGGRARLSAGDELVLDRIEMEVA